MSSKKIVSSSILLIKICISNCKGRCTEFENKVTNVCLVKFLTSYASQSNYNRNTGAVSKKSKKSQKLFCSHMHAKRKKNRQ